MAIPWHLIIPAAASGISTAAASISDRKNRRAQQALDQQALDQQRENSLRSTAMDESLADPFRHQLAQAGAMRSLDELERGKYTPINITPTGPYASYVPEISGGYSYEKSPELIASAGALKRNVMGGNVAPTMTDPINYGKTASLDLLKLAAAGMDPGEVSAREHGGVPFSMDAYTSGVQRREPGKSGKGMDISVGEALGVLRKAYVTELGREPAPGELEQMLVAQGLDPARGHRWVGDTGLRATLQRIRQMAAVPPPSYVGRG